MMQNKEIMEELQNKYDDLYKDFKMLNDSNIKLDQENKELKQIIEIFLKFRMEYDYYDIWKGLDNDYHFGIEGNIYITQKEYQLLEKYDFYKKLWKGKLVSLSDLL